MKEFDFVFTTVDLLNVPSGTEGTIVHVYPNGLACEVEFVLPDGSSAVETMLINQLLKINI
jgi:hypothetical protein